MEKLVTVTVRVVTILQRGHAYLALAPRAKHEQLPNKVVI